MKYEVITWSFEMLSPDELRPARTIPDLEVRCLEIRTAGFVKFLWTSVGEPWYWSDRTEWTDDDWQQLADDPATHISVAYTQGAPVGYFELRRDGMDVEIYFFGLFPEFIGKGYGGHLLNEATRRAWALGAKRVWLHTCNWDGPHAADNYRARGFRLFDETVTMKAIPALEARKPFPE